MRVPIFNFEIYDGSPILGLCEIQGQCKYFHYTDDYIDAKNRPGRLYTIYDICYDPEVDSYEELKLFEIIGYLKDSDLTF